MEFDYLCRKRAVILMSVLDAKFIREVMKESDVQYCYALKVIKKLEQEGLASTEKIGRKRFVGLTEKGENIAYALKRIGRALDEDDKI